jgi:hypothetical protein
MRKSNKGGEFYHGTLYPYMEITQWSPFVQLIYVNKKEGKKKQALEAHTYNSIYSGGGNWEDLSLRPAWAKS